MNKIVLFGRIASDIRVGMTNGENPVKVVDFRLAVRRSRNRDKTDFIPCRIYGRRGDVIEKYFHKGSRITLEGSLQIDSVKKDDGTFRNYTNVIISDFDFVDPRPRDGEEGFASMDRQDSIGTPIEIPESIMEELPFA